MRHLDLGLYVALASVDIWLHDRRSFFMRSELSRRNCLICAIHALGFRGFICGLSIYFKNKYHMSTVIDNAIADATIDGQEGRSASGIRTFPVKEVTITRPHSSSTNHQQQRPNGTLVPEKVLMPSHQVRQSYKAYFGMNY